MSQIIKKLEQEILIKLELKVSLKSFSNHDGFRDGQIKQAIKEFKDRIVKELTTKLTNDYQQQEFLWSVDLVNYEVNKNEIL